MVSPSQYLSHDGRDAASRHITLNSLQQNQLPFGYWIQRPHDLSNMEFVGGMTGMFGMRDPSVSLIVCVAGEAPGSRLAVVGSSPGWGHTSDGD